MIPATTHATERVFTLPKMIKTGQGNMKHGNSHLLSLEWGPMCLCALNVKLWLKMSTDLKTNSETSLKLAWRQNSVSNWLPFLSYSDCWNLNRLDLLFWWWCLLGFFFNIYLVKIYVKFTYPKNVKWIQRRKPSQIVGFLNHRLVAVTLEICTANWDVPIFPFIMGLILGWNLLFVNPVHHVKR